MRSWRGDAANHRDATARRLRAVWPLRRGARHVNPQLVMAAAALGLVVVGGGVALATSSPKPVVRTLSLSRVSIPASGGVVHIKFRAAHATSCVIASSPGIRGLPEGVSCKGGVASVRLSVPSNRYALTRHFRIWTRAVHFKVSSLTSYRWGTQAPRPLRITLTASSHTPEANEPWRYTVRVTSGACQPVSATVQAEVRYFGEVVGAIDSGAVHKAPSGVWTDLFAWPSVVVGYPLTFQVVVGALGTTRRVNYPITVTSS